MLIDLAVDIEIKWSKYRWEEVGAGEDDLEGDNSDDPDDSDAAEEGLSEEDDSDDD